ncbi:CheR family methyltransferase [Chitinibacteraceae bacterium HSL-7]
MGRVLSAALPGSEFAYSDRDFEHVRKVIYQRAGIALSDAKRQMVYSRLARRLRACQLTTFDAYLRQLEQNADDPEWEEFVNALTTNLTSFFREHHHFERLAQIAAHASSTPLRVWCSASSTGEEPYSIAMTLWDHLPASAPAPEIIASDLDSNVLATARAGRYAMDRIEKLDPALLRRHFLRGTGANEGWVRVRRNLRDWLDFRRINLLDPNWGLSGQFDVIFCRNVMIYFDRPTQRRILERFVPLMKPDATLFMGHSEYLGYASDLFTTHGQTTYTLKRPS